MPGPCPSLVYGDKKKKRLLDGWGGNTVAGASWTGVARPVPDPRMAGREGNCERASLVASPDRAKSESHVSTLQ